MTKSTLFDRLNQELSEFGKKAQAALDEGKLQIELLRYRRKQDNAARDLGLLDSSAGAGRGDRAAPGRCAAAAAGRSGEGDRPAGGADRGSDRSAQRTAAPASRTQLRREP